MNRARLAGLTCVAVLTAGAAQGALPVRVASRDAELVLPGQWFAAPGSAPAPVLVRLHGCSGLHDRQGRLDRRYHGFEGQAPRRLRADVPGGTQPGRGVHVGADPAMRAAAALRLEQFIRQTWALP